MKEIVTVVIGDEYDDKLRRALRDVLVKNGVIKIHSTWGVGGSQEIERMKVKILGEEISIEAETYVGISVTGPKLTVQCLVEQVHAQMTII